MAEVEINLGKTPEGHEVTKTSIKILNLGDGLSKSVKVQPIFVHAGDYVFIAVKALKTKDQFEYEFDEDGDVKAVELVQVFSAQVSTFVDEDAVQEAINAMDVAIQAARKLEKTGQPELPIEDPKIKGIDPDICTICGVTRGSDISCDGGSPLHTFPPADEKEPLTGDELAAKGLDKK